MTSFELLRDNMDGSFLLEDLLDQRSLKETALERAAQITPFVKSVTIGPNSSYRSAIEGAERESVAAENVTSPKSNDLKRFPTVCNKSPLTTKDLEAMQRKLQFQSEEKRLKEEVRRRMEERLSHEKEHYQKIQNMIEAMKQEAERKHKAKTEALERQLETALKLEEQEEMKYQKQRTEITKNRRKILEQQEKELRENLNKLEDYFGNLEKSFNKIAQSCNPEMLPIVENFKHQFDNVVAMKISNASSLDGMKSVCKRVEELCHNLQKTSKEFESQSKARQAQKEADARQAQALAAEALNQAKAQEAAIQAARAEAAVVQLPQSIQPLQQNETGRYYNELMNFLNEKQNATKQLAEAKDLETLRFALKVSINNPINILNEQNKSTLIEGFQKLHNLLAGQRITTSKGAVAILDHPQANDWTKLRLAEKLIDVCDKKPDTTFFVANLTVALWKKFPDFGQIFIAKLFKDCPFLAPYKPPQVSGQSDLEFLRSWGYRVTERPEEYAHYQSRTSKFAALLAAIWISQQRRDDQPQHPLGIEQGWKYLINVLNSQPDPMYLHIIDKIFEVAGSTMHVTFGKQFAKLVLTFRDYYLPAVEKNVDGSMKGALDRFRDITMAKFFKENRFQPPKGKLGPNFW